MLTKSNPISTQSNLFHSELFSQLDVKDPLIQLANTINWTVFEVVSINTLDSWACLPCKATLILKIRLKPLTPIRFLKCTNSVALQGIPSHSELFSQLDVKDSLIQLANTINWTVFDDAFEQH
jgi:hypothetical protein